MQLKLFSTLDRPLQFLQTDQFDTPYDAGMPADFHDSMPDQYHLTAQTPTQSAQVRFVAVAALGKPARCPR